jgi:hypothetical protein
VAVLLNYCGYLGRFADAEFASEARKYFIKPKLPLLNIILILFFGVWL